MNPRRLARYKSQRGWKEFDGIRLVDIRWICLRKPAHLIFDLGIDAQRRGLIFRGRSFPSNNTTLTAAWKAQVHPGSIGDRASKPLNYVAAWISAVTHSAS